MSYLAARPSRDLIVAAPQQVTVEWWENALPNLEPFISPIEINTIREISTPTICTPEELMEV